MVYRKYNLEFLLNDGQCTNNSYGQYSILANFLMYWNNPFNIVEDLIPAINFGLKYGVEDRYSKYGDVEGLEQKMKDRWHQSNLEGIREKVNIEESWNRIKDYTGYYISEKDFWLEGIGADIWGIAFVTSINTTIDGSDIGDLPITLPSQDFKEIVIEWLAFILRNKEILPKV
jgi:hypothetical protein